MLRFDLILDLSRMNLTECGRYHNESNIISRSRYYSDGIFVPMVATFGVLGEYN